MRTGFAFIVYILLILTTLLVPARNASASDVDEAKLTKLKAAYLYNLLKFTYWPEDKFEGKDDPIRVVVLGQTPVSEVFIHAVNNRTAQDRTVQTVQLSYPPYPEDEEITEDKKQEALQALHKQLSHSHMVFISHDLDKHWRDIHKQFNIPEVLMVSDMDRFAQRGGIVGLAINDKNRLGFVVNKEALESSGLRLSSSLMKLAEVVQNSQSYFRDFNPSRIVRLRLIPGVYPWVHDPAGGQS